MEDFCSRCGNPSVVNKRGLCKDCSKTVFGAIGKKGGETTKQRYGPAYFRNIGKQGGLARANGASKKEVSAE